MILTVFVMFLKRKVRSTVTASIFTKILTVNIFWQCNTLKKVLMGQSWERELEECSTMN